MISISVKYKDGSEVATAIPQELIEKGDLIQLPSKQWLKLVGTNAHGVKRYEEVDAPPSAKVE